jgi:hypothetical protein
MYWLQACIDRNGVRHVNTLRINPLVSALTIPVEHFFNSVSRM